MQSDFCEVEKNSLNNNNNNLVEMDAACSSQKDKNSTAKELHDNDEDLVDNNVVYSDSDDGEQFNSFEEEEYDVQLSSPPSSRSPSNSDNDQRWYAYRGRWGINMLENGDLNNDQQLNRHNIQQQHILPQQQQHQQQQQQEEEETDFLEMDFEPDTNSEIENENEARFVNYHHNNINNPLPILIQEQQLQPRNVSCSNEQLPQENENQIMQSNKSTGAKPKQFSNRNPKSPKSQHHHATYGDNVFKITGRLYPNNTESQPPPPSSSSTASSTLFNHNHDDDVYNIGASCSNHTKTNSSSSNSALLNDKSYQSYNNHLHSQQHDDYNSFLTKTHKSPSKSSHHSHKQQRLQREELNDQFLFEIEPIKPRNSVTIYTSNCDEKILMDALTSLKLKPDREMIINYFNSNSRPSPDMKLVDYIIYRSKMNCNYLKLVELIKSACKNDDDDDYGTKKFDINFYPLDFFSTTPEMIEIEVSEIVKRWTPQTDLSPLIHIKNKYFFNTNVLGKLVNIIRRINNQKPAIFKENETIKIPQFYVSGYITITSKRNPT